MGPGSRRISAQASAGAIGRRSDCDACHKAVELEDEHVVTTLSAQARALGFSPQTQTLEVHGLCADCAQLPSR